MGNSPDVKPQAAGAKDAASRRQRDERDRESGGARIPNHDPFEISTKRNLRS